MAANPARSIANARRVAVVAGGRTPFVKAGKAFNDLGPLKLACHAVKGLPNPGSWNADSSKTEAVRPAAFTPRSTGDEER